MHLLEPLNFFNSCSDGLTLQGRLHDYLSGESKIKQFVRTPDGTGLAVVRETGGDAWIVHDFGTVLQRAGQWTAADYVVVLNGGKSISTEVAQSTYVTSQAGPLQPSRLRHPL